MASRTVSLKCIIVVTRPGDVPCAGASKVATWNPALTKLGTKEYIVLQSPPQPWTKSTDFSEGFH